MSNVTNEERVAFVQNHTPQSAFLSEKKGGRGRYFGDSNLANRASELRSNQQASTARDAAVILGAHGVNHAVAEEDLDLDRIVHKGLVDSDLLLELAAEPQGF